jgi:hypothetical protein
MKVQNLKQFEKFEHLNFRICFEFRYSDFEINYK